MRPTPNLYTGYFHESSDGERPDPFKKRELEVAEAMFRKLMEHYPGHFWTTEVNMRQGIAQIKIKHLMTAGHGYIIKLKDLWSDPGMMCVVRGGGEILERYKIPRSTFDLSAFLEAKYQPHVRFRGEVPA